MQLAKSDRASGRQVKVSVSLDEELVSELEAGGEALSSQVPAAVRNELARRRRQRLLDEMLEEYERIEGPPLSKQAVE